MNNIKILEKIFDEYKRNVFKLSNYNELQMVSSMYDEELKEKLEIKVNLINNLLKSLPKEDEEFLVSYYINNKSKKEYYLSNSTFYSKLNKIASNFMEYFKVDCC